MLPKNNASQGYDITWYVSSSPCTACVAKVTSVLRQRQTVRLTLLCSRLFQWEEPETCEGLKALAGAGCKLRMMKPADFQHVWETYVEREEESFAPWEDEGLNRWSSGWSLHHLPSHFHHGDRL